MSVMECPVCQGAMREVNRQGVLIDTCTRCRGVWLDRGELEKLSNLVEEGPSSGGFLSPPGLPPRRNDDRSRAGGRYDDDDDDRYGKQPRQRSKVGRFLDFFD
jgi:uncharacterized protein